MMARTLVVVLVLSVLGLVLGSSDLRAQDTTSVVLARFQEARALEIDPSGWLYVADVGRDVIRIFDDSGTQRAALGGPGTRSGEFDEPVALDPTNGQTLLVADAGNGRIQRFSTELQFLEAMPVGRSFGGESQQRAFADGRDGADVQGSGRPVAVVSSNSDETFVVDERDDVVVKFGAQRRAERIIGPGSSLRTPVALALDGTRRLYVADRDHEAILAYDLYGTFVEQLSTPTLPDLRALSFYEGRLWIVCSDQVVVWNPAREATVVHRFPVDASLVDAVPQGDDVYLLTARRLLRVRRP